MAPPPPVVILVSEVIPAYQEVADELGKRLPEGTTVIELSASSPDRAQLVALLKKGEQQQFVAIGLGAAREAKRLAGDEDDIIFCQVFNYQDYDLVGPRIKGVGALPGTAPMFATWHKIAPGLKRVGVITGPGLDNVIADARGQAAKHGIELEHKVVKNDKELLFEYKQLAGSLQGLWLLPDNRVLSGRAIKELMGYSVRNAKQVAVFNDAILSLGGVLSVTSRPEEIAAKVMRRLQDASGEPGVPGPDLVLLEQGEIKVNSVAVRRYNLNNAEN